MECGTVCLTVNCSCSQSADAFEGSGGGGGGGGGWGGDGGGMGRVFDSLYIVKELLTCLIVYVAKEMFKVFDSLRS